MSRVTSAPSRIWHALRRGDALAWRRVAVGAALFLLVGSLVYVLEPMLADFSTYGFHDWDIETAYRYITVISLREYGEGPWWQPYVCGGVPAWGYAEEA